MFHYKPSGYWGTTIYGNPHIRYDRFGYLWIILDGKIAREVPDLNPAMISAWWCLSMHLGKNRNAKPGRAPKFPGMGWEMWEILPDWLSPKVGDTPKLDFFSSH